MRQQIEERLSALQAEFKAGQEILANSKRGNVRVRWCRISGAIRSSKNY
jgi:hypothetical protein